MQYDTNETKTRQIKRNIKRNKTYTKKGAKKGRKWKKARERNYETEENTK